MPEATRNAGVRLRWSGVIGIAISIFLIWWALHDVALAEVWTHLRAVRLLPFGVTIALATSTFVVRAVRWRYLLRSEGVNLPFPPLWHATAIGFMANNLLPARAGEFARAYVARRATGVRFTTAFASIAVERVLDGLVLVLFLVLAIWQGGFAVDTTVGGVTLGSLVRGAGILFAGAFLVALGAVRWPAVPLRLARGLAFRLLPERMAEWSVQLLEGALEGLTALRSPRRLVTVVVWSLVLWSVSAASFAVCLAAFRIEAPLSSALLVQAVIAFGVAIPSAPGFFGPFEVATRVALALYAVDAARAVSYAVGYHLGTFLPITLLGMWSVARLDLHLTDVARGAQAARADPPA